LFFFFKKKIISILPPKRDVVFFFLCYGRCVFFLPPSPLPKSSKDSHTSSDAQKSFSEFLTQSKQTLSSPLLLSLFFPVHPLLPTHTPLLPKGFPGTVQKCTEQKYIETHITTVK
jgi:hypothetical protein